MKENGAPALADADFQTPMMRQYLDLKKRYPDCLLLFRLGDFYEMFMDDAKIGAEILGITLTSRSRGKDGKVPMCGVPFHALDSYLGKLVKAGHKVAIGEQMEDAADAKGMVARDVVRVVTPGTLLDERNLVGKENNYLLALEIGRRSFGLACADLGTGELFLREFNYSDLGKMLTAEVWRIKPAEIILSPANYNQATILRALRATPDINIFAYENWDAGTREAPKMLKKHFSVAELEGFGVNEAENQLSLKAAAALLSYLQETQKTNLAHFRRLSPYQAEDLLRMDAATIANLELFSAMRGQRRCGTLIEILDKTHTAGGGRKLRHWLLEPLRDVSEINQRLDCVEEFQRRPLIRAEAQNILGEILDLERLLARVAVRTASPRDLVGLKVSLTNAQRLADFITEKIPTLSTLLPPQLMEQLAPLTELLAKTIKPEPVALLSSGGCIADGVNAELDECRALLSGSQSWLKEFERKERERTGITSLKVRFNQVFGFYIEISRANLAQAPANYTRKQTLVNAERFIVPELKEREERAMQADEKAKTLEQQIFRRLLEEVVTYAEPVQVTAQRVAEIDVYAALAETAQKNRYIRPQILESGGLVIKAGRHPVIEQLLTGEPFVPNDITLSPEKSQLLLITGPNMAGKSTYLRQVALLTLMAQAGSFVPADEAQIPVRDQIFTRVGAVDNISLGQSTFLVEMLETANILNNCTPQSLVIFDEIGRGTSTYDGISIAWAVVEHLVKEPKKRALTLFATHFHELSALAGKYPAIKNLQMAVERRNNEIIFLHQVIEGSTWQSYGIEVAKLAGLPPAVIKRAQEVLQKVRHEQKRLSPRRKPTAEQMPLLG